MVWYVRLLSPPKLSLHAQATPARYNPNGWRKGTLSLTCPISLTTDLSDAYYPTPATFGLQLFDAREDGWDYALAPVQHLEWKGANFGARVVKANLEFPILTHKNEIVCEIDKISVVVKKIVLRVSAAPADGQESKGRSVPASETTVDDLAIPEFLDIWTAPFHVRQDKTVAHFELEDGPWLQRRFLFEGFWEPPDVPPSVNGVDRGSHEHAQPTESYRKQNLQPEIRLWEEAGESIARHVWDGGIALATHFARLLRAPTDSALSKLLYPGTPSAVQHAPAPDLQILELGAGVGTAGIALAHLLPGSQTRLILTDKIEAADILRRNIESYMVDARTPTFSNAVVQMTMLDWNTVVKNPMGEMARLTGSVSEYGDYQTPVDELLPGVSNSTSKSNNDVDDNGPIKGGKKAVAKAKPLRRSSSRKTKEDEEYEEVPGQQEEEEEPKPKPKRTRKSKPKQMLMQKSKPPFPGWDLIIVSDCTYNEDTLQALVFTLKKVAGKDKMHAEKETSEKAAPLIVVARKPRHESEEAFFALMHESGFKVVEHVKINLPDRTKEIMGLEEEAVDVLLYQ